MSEADNDGVGSNTRTCPKVLGARKNLHELAQPVVFGERVKLAIDRAAKRAGLTYWRAFDIWYGKARRIEQFELDQIAEATERKAREDARNEFHEIQIRMARLEARLAATDAEFHRETIAALGAAKNARR